MKNSYTKYQRLTLIFFFVINSILWSQNNIKKGFKFGIEIKNLFTENTGSFKKTLGFTLGGFTAINLYSFKNSSLLLRTEINFIEIQQYKPGVLSYGVDSSNANWNGLNYTVKDVKFLQDFIEISFIPEYQIRFSKDSFFEIFIGPSIGIGKDMFYTKPLDNNISTDYEAYDEYGLSPLFPISLNVGASFYFKHLVIELRYRNTNFYDSGKPVFTNVFVLLGWAV